MNLATHLQDRRHALKYSVDFVAEKTGLSVGTIRAYEQGRRIPSAVALKKLDEVLVLDGNWYNSTTWRWNVSSDPDQSLLRLSLDKGFHGRQRPNKTEVETLRLALIQKILTADAKTLSAVDMLI